MSTAFVLIFFLWTPNEHAGAAVTFAEFSTKERCEVAGEAAKDNFAGILSSTYWICVPK